MRMRSRVVVFLAVAWMLLSSTGVKAQDWAKAMFDHTSHDFGVVARGAKVEHRFIIENIYEENAHIQSVSSSCGCSTPRINQQFLKTWDKAEILVTVDTRNFLGRKDATITVVLDQPFAAEVQLHIHTYIRSDIVVQPGAILFGTVAQGTGAKQAAAINYAGRDDWKILRIECTNPSLEAVASETNRSPGLVNYSLSVQLKPDAPPGYIRDQIVLVTNDYDTQASRVPIAVEGLVMSALSVRPSPLMMGIAEVGKPVISNLVVQGRKPFRITGISSSDKRFECKASNDAKTAHILPVTFLAKEAASSGQIVKAKIRIETDMAGAGAVEADVSVQLEPPKSTP